MRIEIKSVVSPSLNTIVEVHSIMQLKEFVELDIDDLLDILATLGLQKTFVQGLEIEFLDTMTREFITRSIDDMHGIIHYNYGKNWKEWVVSLSNIWNDYKILVRDNQI